jgi:hypothetical protein
MTKTDVLKKIETAKNSNDSFTMMYTLQQIAVTIASTNDKELKAAYDSLYDLAFSPEI